MLANLLKAGALRLAGRTARRVAAAKEGRARAKAEMPLREGRKALRQHQFGSIGAGPASEIRKVVSLGGNSPLEHLDDDAGRTWDGGCAVRRDGSGEGRKRVRKSLDELSARSCGAPTFHVTSCFGKKVGLGLPAFPQNCARCLPSTTLFPQKMQGTQSVPTNLGHGLLRGL